MPINFTVHYDDLTNDIEDTSGDIGTVAGVGRVYFETKFENGARIPAPTHSPRPAGFWLRTFEGYIDADGRLKNKAGGTPGVRLWANDPIFDLPRLEYRVYCSLTDWLGRELPFQQFHFDAPTSDISMNLADVMPRPGQKFSRGPAGNVVGGHFNEDGQLVLENFDGTSFELTIPEGILAIVDNNNGTVSIG